MEHQRAQGAISLEQQRFQAELILKAIDTEDQLGAVKTLKFFANAGLIPNYEKKILDLAEVEQGALIPALRTPSDFSPVSESDTDQSIFTLSRAVAFMRVRNSYVCTAVLVRGIGLIYPSYCAPDDVRPEEIDVSFDRRSPIDNPITMQVVSIGPLSAGLMVAQIQTDNSINDRAVTLSTRSPVDKEPVFMISHPAGRPQQVSTDCHVVSANTTDFVIDGAAVFSYECRSDYGSGGAPIFSANDNALLGIHVAGDPKDEFTKFGIVTAGIIPVD